MLPTLPQPVGDLSSLIVRTDFSDDAAWQHVLADAKSPEGFSFFRPVDDVAFAGLTPAGCPDLTIPGYAGHLFLADAQSMKDGSVVVVALGEFVDQPGRFFRVMPDQVWGIQANLAIANMGFEEFADVADRTGGVFVGFE